MSDARLYFLSNRYYIDFPDKNLMYNKKMAGGRPHGRPCFLAFRDTLNQAIYWVVPISSKYEKYRQLAQQKEQRYGSCITICLGKVLGRDAAFLIQNMCPTTAEYLEAYIDRHNKPIEVESRFAAEVERKARGALGLAKEGKRLIFPDIFNIYNTLERRLREAAGA